MSIVLNRKALKHTDLWRYGLLLIAGLASVVVAIHLAVIVWLSFVGGMPGQEDPSYTLEYYRDILLDPYTYHILSNTLIFAGVSLAVAMALGLPLAWLVERTDLPGKSVVFTLMTIGLIIPGFSVALGWVFLFHTRIGIVNRFLVEQLGLVQAPINIASLGGMGLIEGISLTPVVFIMTSIVLRTMDSSLEEAAQMAGATLWETLLRITLPLIRPGTMAAGIYVLVIGFGAFDIPAVIGLSARIYTFSTFVYHQVHSPEGLPEYGSAATLSVVMVVGALFLTWWYGAMQRQAPRYAVITGKAYQPRLVKLGSWRYVAVGYVICFFLIAQLLPAAMLVWTSTLPYLQPPSVEALTQVSLQNYLDLPADLILPALENTAILMVAVPTITLAVSFAISWAVLRTQSRMRHVFDFFAFLPHTVPSIIFSVAAWLLSLFILRDIIPIYGTIWILVLVYVVVRLSYGTRVLNSALIQIHKELEEAAKISGANTGGVIRAILFPLLRPALAYTWIWMALLTYRELTLPVILASSENSPLSVVVWTLISTASYGSASAVAVIMLLLMMPILFGYWVVARRYAVRV